FVSFRFRFCRLFGDVFDYWLVFFFFIFTSFDEPERLFARFLLYFFFNLIPFLFLWEMFFFLFFIIVRFHLFYKRFFFFDPFFVGIAKSGNRPPFSRFLFI